MSEQWVADPCAPYSLDKRLNEIVAQGYVVRWVFQESAEHGAYYRIVAERKES